MAKLTDQLMRSLAEMENVRTRTTREVENAKKFGSQVMRHRLGGGEKGGGGENVRARTTLEVGNAKKLWSQASGEDVGGGDALRPAEMESVQVQWMFTRGRDCTRWKGLAPNFVEKGPGLLMSSQGRIM